MLKLVYHCLNSQSSVVNFIVHHSILFGCMNSTIGRNVLSCCERYHTSIDSIFNRTFPINNIVSEDIYNSVNMLNELLHYRDGTFNLSYTLFDIGDIEQLIILVCTN